jgi:hypothetical protein
MTNLSNKQQKNIEAKWGLEDDRDKNLVLMADAIRELVKYRKELGRGIEALEDQVPESVQDVWDQTDEAHRRGRDLVAWREAYYLIQSIFG